MITLYDVLEHVPAPHELLTEARRLLKPGGLLVVKSPNLDSLLAKLTGVEWQSLSLPDHLFHFTPATLPALLEQVGFRIRRLMTWEPADQFWDNIMQLDLRHRQLPRSFRKLLMLSHTGLFFTMLLQPLWWHRGRGAAIEILARKQ